VEKQNMHLTRSGNTINKKYGQISNYVSFREVYLVRNYELSRCGSSFFPCATAVDTEHLRDSAYFIIVAGT
jgi:hypothetical protein